MFRLQRLPIWILKSHIVCIKELELGICVSAHGLFHTKATPSIEEDEAQDTGKSYPIQNLSTLSKLVALNKTKTPSEQKNTPFTISFSLHDEQIIHKIHKAFTENGTFEVGPQIRLPHVAQVLLNLQTNPKAALQFFGWVETHLKLKPHLHLFCIVIHILAKAEIFSSSQELLKKAINANFGHTHLVFDGLFATYNYSNSSPLVFDLLVRASTQLGLLGGAVESFKLMRNHGFIPAIDTCNGLLSFLLKANQRETLWVIYAEMLRSKIVSNVYTFNIMINVLCKEGKVKKAKEFLRDMECMGCKPTVVSYNTIIDGVCKKGRVEEGLDLLSAMSDKGIFPDVFSYSSIIKGLCKGGRVEEAIGYLSEMMERGLEPNIVIYNMLIDGYCNKGDMKKAIEVLDEMVQRGIQPSVCTYNSLYGHFNGGTAEEARKILNKMSEMDLAPDPITYNIMIDGYCKEQKLEEAFKIHAEMVAKGIAPTAVTYTSLISGLCKEGKMEDADQMLRKINDMSLVPDGVTYNILIDGHCKMGNIQRAFELMHEMDKENVPIDYITFKTLMRGLCQNQQVEEAQKLLKEMRKRGIEPDLVTYNTLISGYSKKGKEMENRQKHS